MNLKKLVCLMAVVFACCGAGINVSAMENEVCTDAAANKKVFTGVVFNAVQQGSADEDLENNSLYVAYSPKYLDKIHKELSDLDFVRLRFIDPNGHELLKSANKQFCGTNSGAENLPIFGQMWDHVNDLCLLSIPCMKDLKLNALMLNAALDKEFEIKEGATYKIQLLNKHGEVVLEDSFETIKVDSFYEEMADISQRVAHLDDDDND